MRERDCLCTRCCDHLYTDSYINIYKHRFKHIAIRIGWGRHAYDKNIWPMQSNSIQDPSEHAIKRFMNGNLELDQR